MSATDSPKPMQDVDAHTDDAWRAATALPAPRGWLVTSLDGVIARLQRLPLGRYDVRRNPGWIILAQTLRLPMAIVQLIVMLLAWIPIVGQLLESWARVRRSDAMGRFLRACYWKSKLRHLGQDTIIGPYVTIQDARFVSIGARCHIDAGVRIEGGHRHSGPHGVVRIGNYVHLDAGSRIAGRGDVTIGNFACIMADAQLVSERMCVEPVGHPATLVAPSPTAPGYESRLHSGPIVVGEFATIGPAARLHPHAHVGRGANIQAGDEIDGAIPPFAQQGGMATGRQIGWRMPLRKSPNWRGPPVVIEGAEGAPTIREIIGIDEAQAIEGVLDLHCDAFSEGITTQLGRNFIRRYYIAMICDPDCSLWIAEHEGRVVGFLGCTTNRHRFETNNRSGVTRFLAIWRFATFRLNPIAILRALRKQSLSQDYADAAELLSIVVAPDARRHGLGKRFLDIWRQELEDAGLASYIVFTDNPEGINFYEKYGGERLFKFQMADKQSACYRFLASRLGGAKRESAEAGQSES